MLKKLFLIPLILNTQINITGNNLYVDFQYANQIKENHTNSGISDYNYYTKATDQTQFNEYVDIKLTQYSAIIEIDAEPEYNIYMLYVLQINPYFRIESTSIDFEFVVSTPLAEENLYISDLYTNIYTTDQNLSQYMDLYNWINDDTFYDNVNQHIKEDVGSQNINTIHENNQDDWQTSVDHEKFYGANNINITTNTYLVFYAKGYIMSGWAVSQATGTKNWHVDSTQIDGTLVPVQQQPTIEVVDIAGLMFQILSMPFAFISQAFNLTLFPNTPYEFNVSNFFLGIIGVALLLWIVKIILGRADLGTLLEDTRSKTQEIHRHNRAVEREQTSHNNKLQEQRTRESHRHERASKKK